MVIAAPREVAKPAPYCADCQIPASFKTVVSQAGKPLRVYQCQNCAKVIWSE